MLQSGTSTLKQSSQMFCMVLKNRTLCKPAHGMSSDTHSKKAYASVTKASSYAWHAWHFHVIRNISNVTCFTFYPNVASYMTEQGHW